MTVRPIGVACRLGSGKSVVMHFRIGNPAENQTRGRRCAQFRQEFSAIISFKQMFLRIRTMFDDGIGTAEREEND